MESDVLNKRVSYLFGYRVSILLSVLTIITFGFALMAVPISGAFCPNNCIEYPYLNTFSQYPRDFIWMYWAMALSIVYLLFMVSVHYYSAPRNKIYTQAALLFALISSMVLLVNYFIQSSVVPASLKNNETEGLALLIQYNPHGIFIAMEELGFILMSLSFVFSIPAFECEPGLKKIIRLNFAFAFVAVVIAFIYLTFKHGLERKDRFEVAIISINWLVLIVNGILISRLYKKELKVLSNKKSNNHVI